MPLYFGGYWLRALRWRYILRPIKDVPTSRLYPALLISLMANNLAGRIGELVRSYLVGEQESVPKSTVLGTVAVDRTFDGLALVGILAVATAFAGAHEAVRLTGIATAVLFAGVIVAMAVLSFSMKARELLRWALSVIPGGIGTKLDGLAESFLDGLAAIRSPAASWRRFCCRWAPGCRRNDVLRRRARFRPQRGLRRLSADLAAANLALSIVASPGGVGPFESATRAISSRSAFGAGTAEAYALALHALLLGPVIVIGLSVLLGHSAASRWTRSWAYLERSPVPAAPRGTLE